MAPKATTWDDALIVKFLMAIIDAGGPSGAVWKDLAEKWGPPHTKDSLSVKWNRLRRENQKRQEASAATASGVAEGADGTETASSVPTTPAGGKKRGPKKTSDGCATPKTKKKKKKTTTATTTADEDDDFNRVKVEKETDD